jgi:hypothetical protein
MWEWFKRLIAGKELDALARYRSAVQLTYRWNGQVRNSAETARWVQLVGEGEIGSDISGFREALERGKGQQYLDAALKSREEWARFCANQQGV